MTAPLNDNEFVLMRQKSNGVVTSYPYHYLNHPVFGDDLELYTPDVAAEYEEDKVVVSGHELPVDQRSVTTAKALEDHSYSELQAIAHENDLKASGSKTELIERIQDNKVEEN